MKIETKTMTQEQLVDVLLTPDGKGVEAKTQALRELICREVDVILNNIEKTLGGGNAS